MPLEFEHWEYGRKSGDGKCDKNTTLTDVGLDLEWTLSEHSPTTHETQQQRSRDKHKSIVGEKTLQIIEPKRSMQSWRSKGYHEERTG